MNDAEKLKLEERLKAAAPVINRLGDGPSPLPDHVRARLNTALDKKFPLPKESAAPVVVAETVRLPREPNQWFQQWRWWVGLATAAAVVAMVLNRPSDNPNLPAVIQVAMLDSVGAVRGTSEKPMDTLQRQWKTAKPQEFDDANKLKRWQEEWPVGAKQTVVKILYNVDTLELRVLVRSKEGTVSEKVFVVKEERELPKALNEAEAFIREKSK